MTQTYKKHPMRDKPDPKDDGIKHININSKSEMRLGRLLTNFRYTVFDHPHYGSFCSIEGFDHYLCCKGNPDIFRGLSGKVAKDEAKNFIKNIPANREEELLFANYQKVIQTPEIKQLLLESELPFEHYYISNGGVVIEPRDSASIRYQFEKIREALKNGEEIPSPNYAK